MWGTANRLLKYGASNQNFLGWMAFISQKQRPRPPGKNRRRFTLVDYYRGGRAGKGRKLAGIVDRTGRGLSYWGTTTGGVRDSHLRTTRYCISSSRNNCPGQVIFHCHRGSCPRSHRHYSDFILISIAGEIFACTSSYLTVGDGENRKHDKSVYLPLQPTKTNKIAIFVTSKNEDPGEKKTLEMEDKE